MQNYFNRQNILPIIVFVFYLLLRFWNFDKRVGFDWDHENYMNDIYNLVVNHKLTLIGPRVNNDSGFFLGPYFTYLTAPLFLISYGNVTKFFWILLILVNSIYFWFSYFVLKSHFSWLVGVFFLLFWSINLILINYDTNPWWPVLIPLGAITSWYFLEKIYKENKLRDWICLAVLNGIFMNMHFQYIFVLLFNWFFLLLFILEKKKINFLHIFWHVIFFGIMFCPLLVFDIRHDFLNSKQFIEFFFGGTSQPSVYRWAWLDVFGNFIQPIVFFKNQYLTIFFYSIIFLFIVYLLNTTKKFQKIFFKSVLILWITFQVFFFIYGKRPSEYYFMFLYPFIYLTLSFLFSRMKRCGTYICVMSIIITLIFLLVNNSVYSDNPMGLYYKNLTVARIREVAGNIPVRVNLNTEQGRNVGFNYLIKYHKINTSKENDVPSFEITIPPKGHHETFGRIGLQIPKL